MFSKSAPQSKKGTHIPCGPLTHIRLTKFKIQKKEDSLNDSLFDSL